MIKSGVRVINNSWGVSIPDFLSDGGRDPNALHFELKDAQEQFDQVKPLLGSWLAQVIRALSTPRARIFWCCSPRVTTATTTSRM
ncbi:hypothetical protein AK51_31705 [Serratia nematodiphila DZ0503SBS1]|nr:hypothetical protein AK51_31705 [Serratia nematodiphila DZ0503SBS1]